MIIKPSIKLATVNDFGIPGVGSGTLQPKLKHRWRVTFANLGEDVSSQDVSLQAITITRPSISFDEVQLDRYVNRSYVAGKYTWEPLTLTVEDDVSGRASKIIKSQLQKQQWLIGTEGPFLGAASEGFKYKFTTFLDMLDGNEQLIEKWSVEGCWIKTADYTDLDYASSDKVHINLTLRFDHASQDLGGYIGGGNALRGIT